MISIVKLYELQNSIMMIVVDKKCARNAHAKVFGCLDDFHCGSNWVSRLLDPWNVTPMLLMLAHLLACTCFCLADALPTCLLAYLPACSPTHLLAHLLTCLPLDTRNDAHAPSPAYLCLPACLLACLCLPACLFACLRLLACLFSCLCVPTCLFACLLTNLPTMVPCNVTTMLPHLLACLLVLACLCLPACSPSCLPPASLPASIP